MGTYFRNIKSLFDDISEPVYSRFDSAITEHNATLSDKYAHMLSEFFENFYSKLCGGLYWLIILVSILLFLTHTALALIFNITDIKTTFFSGDTWSNLISLITFLVSLYYINLSVQKDLESYMPGREYARLAIIVRNIATSYFTHLMAVIGQYDTRKLTESDIKHIKTIKDETDNFLFLSQIMNRKLLQLFVSRDDHLEYDYGLSYKNIEDFHDYLINNVPDINIIDINDHVEFIQQQIEKSICDLSFIYNDIDVNNARLTQTLNHIEKNFCEFQDAIRTLNVQEIVPTPSGMTVIRWILIASYILIMIPIIGYESIGLWTLIFGTIMQIVLIYPLIVLYDLSNPFDTYSHYRQANYFGLRTKIYQTNYRHYKHLISSINNILVNQDLYLLT